MSGFTFGLNAPTFGVVICIVILVALSLVGVFFLGKKDSNKKSDETTPWNTTNYNMLTDKINLIMKSEGIQTAETFSDVPTLLDCVTNSFTLHYDAKVMNNSNFNDIVKKLIYNCKHVMEKRVTDPHIPDPDPGPPVWTDRAIKMVKNEMVNMFYTQTIKPTDTQIDCMIGKLKNNANNPRNLRSQSGEEVFALLKKITKDCNYDFIITTSPSPIIWDDANLQKLKFRIISLSDDSSISYADQTFFDCVTSKITKSYNDSSLLTDDTKFKPLVNQLIQECKRNGPILGGGWTQVAIDQIKSDMKNSLVQMLGKDPTNEQLDCIVNKIVARFKSPSEMASIDPQQGMALMQNFLSECVSLWSPEVIKQFKDEITRKLSELGEKNTDTELNCIVDNIKRLYKNPSDIQDLGNVVMGMYPVCTGGRKLPLPGR